MFVKRLCLMVIIFFGIFLLTHLTLAQTWTQLFPTGSTQTIRVDYSAVYDPASNRMITFGGVDNSGWLNSVWVLSTANGLGGTPGWTQLFPTPDSTQTNNGFGGLPATRSENTVIYDAVNNRMTIFGGNYFDTTWHYLNDVWVLNHANGLGGTPSWTQLSPNGNIPFPGSEYTAVYDTTHNCMIIFEGYSTVSSAVWVLSNANGLDSTTSSWELISMLGNDTALSRDGETAIYDETNNIMTIFGGENYYGYLNDVWTLSNANGLDSTIPTWTQLTITGNTPFPRGYLGAVYDNVHNQMVIFGGFIFGITSTGGAYIGALNDTWVLTNANGLGGIPFWTELNPSGTIPPARSYFASIYDNVNNRMAIFGGANLNGSLNDAWVLSDANGLFYPSFTNVPSLKLFTNQSFNPAFDLTDYNTGGVATTYSIDSNFLTLSTLTGSTVYQSSFNTATVGTNIYEADNVYGSSTASNLVKYSTYKIYKLPHVGLTVGSSWDVNVGNYTYNGDGLGIPPSFGSPDALIVSDTTSISATWVGNTIVHITSLQPFSGAVNVDVIASPNANSPFGVDIDKERIQVYNNLWAYGTFSTAQDTASYGYQNYPYNIFPTMSWLSSYTDSAGTQANGVWALSFSNNSSNISVKATPFESYWQTVIPGQWYIARMRITSDTSNNNLIANLYAFTYPLTAGVVGDIAANNYYGIPTTWTWIETPILSLTTSSSAFLQFQLVDWFPTNANGNVYIDELQWIQATPELIQARSNTQAHYPYGQFTAGSDTTGWGQQICVGAVSGVSDISVNNGLVLDFSGASQINTVGIKWTANNGVQGPGHAYTYPMTPGRDVGMRATVTLQSGDFNSIWIILLAAIGVQTSGQQSINPPCNIIASAQVGALTGGDYRAVGTAIDPYYQFQFEVRGNEPSVLVLNDIDFDTDNDDPNFGDPTLFP